MFLNVYFFSHFFPAPPEKCIMGYIHVFCCLSCGYFSPLPSLPILHEFRRSLHCPPSEMHISCFRGGYPLSLPMTDRLPFFFRYICQNLEDQITDKSSGKITVSDP